MRYETFEVRVVTQRGGSVAVEARCALGEVTTPIELLPEDRWDSGESSDPATRQRGLGPETEAQGEARSATEIGRELFASVFPPPVLELFDRFRGFAEADEGAGVVVQLRFDPASPDEARTAQLPWELLTRIDRPIGLDPQTPIVRYLLLPNRVPPFPLPYVLRILVVSAEPNGLRALEQSEPETIKKAWDQDNIEVTPLFHATRVSLQQELARSDYHLVHFVGHGRFDEEGQKGTLFLEKEDRSADEVCGEEFAAWLTASRSIRLVVLNACDTGATGQQPFSGTATALVGNGVPAVLAMRREIPDRLAIEFSKVLYQRLALGASVEAAVTAGRQRLQVLLPADDWWSVPALFSRSREIFRLPAGPRPMLTWWWTAIGVLLSFVWINALLSNRKSGLELIFRDVHGDVVQMYAMYFTLPLLYLIYYLSAQYVRGVREPGLVARLPVAFRAPILGRRTFARRYQWGFFIFFLVLPLLVQIHFLVEFVEKPVFLREQPEQMTAEQWRDWKLQGWGDYFLEHELPVSTWKDENYNYVYNFAKYRGNDQPDGPSFYPLLLPWGLLILQLGAAAFFLWLSSRLFEQPRRRRE